MAVNDDVAERWCLLRPYLDRQQQILWAAAEAETIGRGGKSLLTHLTGISTSVITARVREMRSSRAAQAGSLAHRPSFRRSGAGRKLVEEKDPNIGPDLAKMLADEIAGDPMTGQQWVRSSLRVLSKRLKEQNHHACTHTVARLLRKMGYSLRVSKRKQAGATHPDRDKQFTHISSQKVHFLEAGLPVISVDTKKKEMIGNYRREGKTWRKIPIETEDFFASHSQCIAVPFGIYDLAKNCGFVTVGVSHNTAEFAVNCLATWWQTHGRLSYPEAEEILILADGGGGNGHSLRAWKKDLQEKVCDVFNMRVTVSHYPTGCSKWNPIEYRLFSQISINWAGRPLRDLDTMLGYIKSTSTTTGLKVHACLDQQFYRKGRMVTDKQMKQLTTKPHEVCPNWNYTISPGNRV